jgi:dipeptidyl aminopeptidase/acylaminoacyl peptidase
VADARAERPDEEPTPAGRAFRPVLSERGGLVFASDLAGVPTIYRLAEPDRFPRRVAGGEDRVLPVGSTSRGLLVRRDHGGDEAWQLAVVDRDGRLVTLTTTPGRVHRSATVSPDGARVGFAYAAGGEPDWQLAEIDLGTGVQCDWQCDWQGHSQGWRGSWTWLAYRPDGRAAVVARHRHTLLSTAHLVAPASPPVPLLPASRQVASAAWLDDRLLAVTDDGHDHLGVVEVDPARPDRPARTVWRAANDVAAAVPDPAGTKIALAVVEGPYDGVVVTDLRDLATVRLPLPPGVLAEDGATEPADALAWAPDGDSLFVAWESPAQPAEIYQLPADGTGEPVRWTWAAGDAPPGAPQPVEVDYPSFDGLRVPALHYRCPGPARATVVWFHGGPEGQSRAGYSELVALLTAHGYDVLAPNVRGSTGYGRRYAGLDDRELRWGSVRDASAAASWVRRHGRSPSTVAMGRSYGGFVTLATLVDAPASWDAGVDIAGIGDWLTFFDRTSTWRRAQRIPEYGDPDGPDREFLARFSPLRRADEIRAPLLLVHGRNDARVPLAEAEQVHRAVPSSELLVFDDEGHHVTKRRNVVRTYRAVLDFLSRRLPA